MYQLQAKIFFFSTLQKQLYKTIGTKQTILSDSAGGLVSKAET